MFRIRLFSRAILPFLAAIIALLVAVPAIAQTEGKLAITVIDDDMELPIPGVSIELSTTSAALGAQTKSTDGNGEAVFSALPPGRYQIVLTKAGFKGITMADIPVQVNRTNNQTITMSAGSDIEVVEVTATRDAVDVNDTTQGTVLTKDFLQRIPAGRSYQSAVALAPGVTGGGGNPNVAGGASNENTYMLDGANITDPVTGTFSVNFNFDAIEQIEVLLGGYMPEYGTSLGGVINLVTESGTNNLQFDSSVFYNNGNWRPRMDDRWTADGLRLAPNGFDSEFQLLTVASKVSGPLVRDRAWFIISYQHARSIIANTGIPQTRDYDGHYVLAKLTVQPTSEHRLTGFFQLDPTSIDNIDQGDPFQKSEAQGRQVQGGFIGQMRWQWFLTPDVNVDTMLVAQKTFIEVNGVPCTHNDKFNYHRCEPGELEGSVDWETPGRIGLYGAFNSVNYGYYYFDDRWRYNASSKLSLVSLKDPLGGMHDVKIGVEGIQTVWDQIQGYSGNQYFVDLNLVPYDPQTFMNYYWIDITGPIKFRTSGSQWNAFIQDSWKPVSNVTLNYGLRFDNFVMRNDLGEPVLGGSLLGPRLFGAWDPFKDQRTKIATGYGRFNDTGRLGTSSFTSARAYGSKLFIGPLFNDSADGGGILPNTAGAYDYDPATNFNFAHDNLRTPRVDEVLLTLEREVVEDLAAFSRMHGKFVRFQYEYDDVNILYDSDGSAIIGARNGNPTQGLYRQRTPALAKRDYFQWDLGVDKIPSHRWSANFTYTYSQSIGSTTQANSGSFRNDPQTQFNYGNLNTDLRHVIKSFGFWDLPTDPWKQTIGFFFEHYSGVPYERRYWAEGDTSGFGGYDIRIRPRGTYFRGNAEWRVSVKFQQEIDVRKGKLIIDLEAQNLFNNRAPDSYSTSIYTDNRLQTLSRQDPLRLQAGLRYKF